MNSIVKGNSSGIKKNESISANTGSTSEALKVAAKKASQVAKKTEYLKIVNELNAKYSEATGTSREKRNFIENHGWYYCTGCCSGGWTHDDYEDNRYHDVNDVVRIIMHKEVKSLPLEKVHILIKENPKIEIFIPLHIARKAKSLKILE